MLTYLFAGLSLGLSAGLAPGPLFATVIAQTVRFGLREGAKTACSPLLTALPIILASVWLLASLAAYRQILGLVALAVSRSRRAFTGRGYTLVMRVLAGGLFILAILLLRESYRLLS